jgi:hypothetical protein
MSLAQLLFTPLYRLNPVKIERLKLVDKDGYTVSAVIRIPKTATSETPAPAMIVVPGGDCTADIAAPWAIELTRRGYVTLTMDYTGAGDTEVNMAEQYWGTNGTMHLSTGYDYLTSLDFVDQDNIGAGGHSMGSLYSYRLALHRKVNVVVSDVIFFDDLPDYDFNFVQLTAIHDEGILSRVSTYEDVYKDPLLTGLFGVDRIEPGKLYGSWENNTARIFYEFNHTHQDDMISPKLISRMVDCVTLAMPTGTRLDSNNLVYGWKILGLFVAISGMVMFLFSFASVLLKTKVFGKLVLKPGARVGFKVSGRGELHLSILIENMRRQGYEFQVSKPSVIYKEIDEKLHEPMELVTIDVPEKYAGTVIEKMGSRKGEMVNMVTGKGGNVRLEFSIPARGLFGYRSEFMTDTRGEGILNSAFNGYQPFKGEIATRNQGSLVAFETGEAVSYGIFNAQERGHMFISPGMKVYEGMVVGENSRQGDIEVNVCKRKHATNIRASGSDEAIRLVPPKILSLEQALEFIDEDELVEITPKTMRIRKAILNTSMRKRAARNKG